MVLSAAARFPTLPIPLPGGCDRAEDGEETGGGKKMKPLLYYFLTSMRAQGATGSDRAVVFVLVTWLTWLLPFLLIVTLTLNTLSRPVAQTSDLSCKCESLLLRVKIPLAVCFSI